MRWIIVLLIVAAGIWVYYNVDFSNFKSDSENTIRQEKTLKKFFSADEQNKEETRKVLEQF